MENTINPQKKQRNSNIELLRIFSMICVIIHHFSLYGGYNNINNLTVTSYAGKIMFTVGKLGVDIFVLISGYFLINAKFSFKKIIKFWIQILFYSVGIMLIVSINNLDNIKLSEIYKCFFPISYSRYWFASTYLYMYVLFPFINKFAHSINKNKYKFLLIILTIMFSGIYSVLYCSNSYQTGVGIFEAISWFIYLYLLAGYIKIYGIKFFENKIRTNIITMVLVILFIIFVMLLHTLDVKYNILGNLLSYYITINSIFILILAVSIMYCFINMKPRYYKIVNLLGSSSFAVYLLHEHKMLRMTLWNYVNDIMMNHNINIIVMTLICIVFLYVIATIIEFIRIRVFENNLFKIKKVESICNKINVKFNIE